VASAKTTPLRKVIGKMLTNAVPVFAAFLFILSEKSRILSISYGSQI
jgi:hypothetical protein